MSFNRLYEDSEFEANVTLIFDNDINDLVKENNNFYYHYFLSPKRHNLFNWYPFKKNASLLEIGADYGQLTGLFTQKTNHVVVVEDNEFKLNVISKRFNEIDTFFSYFDNINVSEKFDYIILCNIFEYAKSFYSSKTPYIDYLKYLKNFLNEDGVILLALSNKLGLKYFSGFKEEHTNEYFSSINGYDKYDFVETFSKSELIKIIKNAGFSNYKFFYPFPDHEFPEIIHTNKYINKMPYTKVPEYYLGRKHLFNDEKLNVSISDENLLEYFSNSFLVEIRNSDYKPLSENIDFVKINSERIDEFKTITLITSDKTITKSPMTEIANNYVEELYSYNNVNFGKIKNIICDFEDNNLSYEFLYENSLETLINHVISDNDKNKLIKLIESYYNALFFNSIKSNEYMDDKFLDIFKTTSQIKFHCHEKSNMDLLFSNIFIVDDEFIVSNSDWLFDFPIPLEYIFYRVINHQYNSNIYFREFITIGEILNHFNLDMSYINLFEKWERNFQKYIKGDILKPVHELCEDELDDNINGYLKLDYNSTISDELKKDIVLNQKKIINQKNIEIKKKDEQIKRKNNEIKNKNKKFNELLNSTSWKITKPLRKLKQILK